MAVTSVEEAEASDSGEARSRRLGRVAAAVLIPAAAVTFLFLGTSRLGFSPTDDGHLLAQSWRVLHGEVPHRDFISARPAGSVIVHTVDFALPMPVFEATRLVGLLEMAVTAWAFAWLLYGRQPTRWRPIHYLGALGSLMVNIHVFPVMGWHTIDGLLFSSVGLLAVDRGVVRGSRALSTAGMLSLGLAPLMKQSFALVPLLGVLRVAWGARPGTRTARASTAGVIALVPLMLYAGTLAAVGGLGDAFEQIRGARPAYGAEFSPLKLHGGTTAILSGVAALIVAVVMLGRARRRTHVPSGGRRVWMPIMVGAASGLVLWVPLAQKFRYPGDWGLFVAWALVVYLVVDAIAHRAVDFNSFALASLAWMTSISWGWNAPDLVAGSAGLALLFGLWTRHPPMPAGGARFALVVAATLATVMVGIRFGQARSEFVYRDRPSDALTATLRSVSPEFGHIRTNPVTLSYMQQIKECVATHPASRVAVVPDNAAVYPALHLRNPLVIDWLRDDEIGRWSDRLLQSARGLDRRGDFLVLFQTVAAGKLPQLDKLPVANSRSVPFTYDRSVPRIMTRLSGQRIYCGSFLGVYRPPRG